MHGGTLDIVRQTRDDRQAERDAITCAAQLVVLDEAGALGALAQVLVAVRANVAVRVRRLAHHELVNDSIPGGKSDVGVLWRRHQLAWVALELAVWAWGMRGPSWCRRSERSDPAFT